MPVVGTLFLGRRAVIQHAAHARSIGSHIHRSFPIGSHVDHRSFPIGKHVHRSFPIGKHVHRSFLIGIYTHRSFSYSRHVKSDHLSASRQSSLLDTLLSEPPSIDTDSSFTSPLKHEDVHSESSKGTSNAALRTILDRRLQNLADAHSATSTSVPLDEEETKIIHSLGYTQHQVDLYTEILFTPDSLSGARLLITAVDAPYFLYHQFLLRRQIRPDALRLLLDYLPTWTTAITGPRSNLVVIVFYRLLDHCRRVWPDAMEFMATYLTQHLRLSDADLLSLHQGDTPASSIARLTSDFNKALLHLAKPSHMAPFKMNMLQEASQAIILRHMADHNPPLIINRIGYRAVARVQLAARKTPSEQEWARLKSPSWPPWKEDRTGMDARIDQEYGISRAHHVFLRMQEAGYPLRAWDRVAMVYAGWDTDRSPTIQKRVVQPLFRTKVQRELWIARIKTTRTVQQAWACFLAHQDEHLPSDPRIYHAMFEVLLQERKRLNLGPENIGHEVDDRDHVLDPLYPGDTLEIGSPPSSTHQLTYVRVEIPSVQKLYDHMREDGLSPANDTLAMLIDSAESLAEGLAYLETGADKNFTAVHTLLHDVKNYHQDLDSLPNLLFTSYIRLLCRFPHTPLNPQLKLQWRYGSLLKANFDLRQPLARALNLLVQQKRQYRPAWNCIFKALARRLAPTLASSWRALCARGVDLVKPESKLYDQIFAFNLTRQVNLDMWENDLTLDEDAFLDVCIIAEHAASAVHTVFQDYGYKAEHASEATARLITNANTMFQEGPAWMRKRFYCLVSGMKDALPSSETSSMDTERTLPGLYVTPGPALLHAYIRALGLLRDFSGLEELVHWMVDHQIELAKRRAMDRRGSIMMRKALTALRVFLEDRWEPSEPTRDDDGEVYASFASPEQVEAIATLVDRVDGWGGWPSDEEVEYYINRGQGRE
jgi:hypothetical protein